MEMNLWSLMVIVGAILATTIASNTMEGFCECNVDVDALNEHIEQQVNSILANEPVVKYIGVTRDNNNQLKITTSDGHTAAISLADPSKPVDAQNNELAYRPRFPDYHQSGLGTGFINLEKLFPCFPNDARPTCFRATFEEDGFNKGRALLEAADGGNHFKVFSTSEEIYTYAFAFQDCEEFNMDCLPPWYAFTVVCLLPREHCG